MGGDSSSQQPTFSFGDADPTFTGGGGFDYSGLGQSIQKGAQSFGQSMMNQPVPNFMGQGTGNYAQANIPNATPQNNLIPVTQGGNPQIIEALMRLLSQGAA